MLVECQLCQQRYIDGPGLCPHCVACGLVDEGGRVALAPDFCSCPRGRALSEDVSPRKGHRDCWRCQNTGVRNAPGNAAPDALVTVSAETVADIRKERGLPLRTPKPRPQDVAVQNKHNMFMSEALKNPEEHPRSTELLVEAIDSTIMLVADEPFDEAEVIERLESWYKSSRGRLPSVIRVLEGDFVLSEDPDEDKDKPGLIAISYVGFWVFEGDEEALLAAYNKDLPALDDTTKGVARA